MKPRSHIVRALVSLALVFALVFALAACGDDDTEPDRSADVLGEPDIPERTCALITDADVERLMGGAPTAAGVEGTGLEIGCRWAAGTGGDAAPKVTLALAVGDPTGFERARDASNAQPVVGAGDEAVLRAGRRTGDTQSHTLAAYRGDYYVALNITGPLTTAQATPLLRDVANAVFENLRG